MKPWRSWCAARSSAWPATVAHAFGNMSLAVCLEAPFDGLYQILMDQLAQDPDLFSIPGDDTGAAGFGKKWMHAMKDLTNS
ncbi:MULTISPECIES: hypothetical protein [unclassified Streptomyces]|uniref:hypothetical protein n=1 Tax=unclassified Streptomyces TaxID=2593676 RepID=UPI00093A0107|nr:hypothetical protein [Streptomyces sp. CB01883]OKJ74313.1 hypothetical protein AMK32_35460 [Streptomyces sp. CB01883]